MMFKPRIFISSTLGENLEIRSNLKDFYASVGAEVMLYEKTLTPSVNTMTYRKDILDADFIIMIIKDDYGKRTEKGISGTHEKLRIALDTKIPMHVYIKLEEGKRDADELIKEINNNKISFYYFKTDKDLFKRIKETTFTIAKEIMLKNIEDARLPKETVKKISGEYDYGKAMEIINIVESMIKTSNSGFDWVDSTIFTDFIGPIDYENNYQPWIFIDKKLQDIFGGMLSVYHEYEWHGNDYTSIAGSHRTVKVPVLGEVILSRCSASIHPKYEREHYESIFERFLEKYIEFREYVGRMRLSVDTVV